MNRKYCTTFSEYSALDEKFTSAFVPNPIVPEFGKHYNYDIAESEFWDMISSAATETHLFWFWGLKSK